jgi:hypothetical protein
MEHPKKPRFRWRLYRGWRIVMPGIRTAIWAINSRGAQEMRYGYAWRVSDGFRAYYEVLNPGTTEDVELGTFSTEAEARRAVETALLTTPAFTKSMLNTK